MSSKSLKYSALLAACLGVAALAGCGSSNKSGSTHLTKVGDTACVQCHSAVTEALTGQSIIAQYENSSPHNSEALGCESCHGAGSLHNGVGPIPYPEPDANRCATCHDGVTARATNANTAFETSNHATGTPSHTSGLCVRCHTHEGAVLSNISGYTGDGTVFSSAAYVPPAYTGAYTAFKCETCHEHGGGLRSILAKNPAGLDVAWNPSGSRDAKNNQFNLCTSCHTIYNYNGSQLLASGTVASGTGPVGYHETRWNRIIASTHYDNPATGYGLASNVVEGYVIRKTGENPCFDCHGHEAKTLTNPSETETTIHKEWAQSGHAGGLLAAKYAAADGSRTTAEVDAVMAAGATSATGDGWVHYNWDKTYSAGTTNDRGYCQKCHTSTGVSNFLSSPSTYDETGANNNFSHLSGWTQTAGSTQNELLYCWGCHSNAGTGALRNSGALTITFDADKAASFQVTMPDAKKSNVCVACHTGRGNKNSAPVSRDGSAYHHGVAAGTLFSSVTHTGFEFDGLNYANPSYFKHDIIGTDTANGSGPCASCHMSGKSHSFKAVDAATQTITNQALCDTCHTAEHGLMTYATIEEESAGYQNAGALLVDMVKVQNAQTNYTGSAILYSTTVANDYKAHQNSKLSSDEAGGFVHNRIYVKRLIFDSIDWLDNGALNGTITIPAAYAEARAWLGADASGVVTRRP